MTTIFNKLNEVQKQSQPVLKHARPLTPGSRHQNLLSDVKDGVQRQPKELTTSMVKSGGRNQSGKRVTRHVGGGRKHSMRQLTPLWPDHRALVIGTQWDPLRSSPISLVADLDTNHRSLSYVLTGEGMKRGSLLVSSRPLESSHSGNLVRNNEKDQQREILPNSRCRRSWLPVGATIYDRSIDPSTPFLATRFRSAGAYGTIRGHGSYHRHSGERYTRIRCPSGEERRFPSSCYATVGKVSCEEHHLETLGKAGKRRSKGVRPTVRGCAMNPIDHPHGGRTKGGRHDVTPWAMIAKGQSTRLVDARSSLVLKTSRQAKKAKQS